MLLTIDIGNTNITCGVFNGEELRATFRLTTKQPRTSDEFGFLLCEMLQLNKIQVGWITDVIIASVVPDVMYSLTSAAIKFFDKTPIIVAAGTRTGIRIVTRNPSQIGADRIVDAAAAYNIYGGPVIVVDYGTATTFDLVDEKGSFLAGVTAPGIRSSAQSMWATTAKLPEFEIIHPDSILGKDTISSMQAGLMYGQIGQTEYIIRRMKEEACMGDIKVVATGGLGGMIARATKAIDVYDPMLTLKGMRIVYEKQKK